MEYIPTTEQFVCILSKKVPLGRAMNALGHVTVGLTAQVPAEELKLRPYIDADKNEHPAISDNPFIVLKAKNSGLIRKIRQALVERGVPFSDFTDAMIEGNYAEQHDRMNGTKEEDLEYYALAFFMNSEEARELTKRCSLYQ